MVREITDPNDLPDDPGMELDDDQWAILLAEDHPFHPVMRDCQVIKPPEGNVIAVLTPETLKGLKETMEKYPENEFTQKLKAEGIEQLF